MVKFNELGKQYEVIKDRANKRLEKLFAESSYIDGPDVKTFENNFAKYVNTKFAVGVSNGTDAIELAVQAIGIKNGGYGNLSTLYLIPTNTFIATALGIAKGDRCNESDIITIDCDEFYQIDIEELELELKNHRRDYSDCVIVGVHLYGHCCNVKEILRLCEEYDCTFLEDASQSHGTVTELGRTGSIGLLSAFSLYPGKNLGACGDAGIITTNNEELRDILIRLRNFGSKDKYTYEYAGANHRLDSIQAIFLDEKLNHLDAWNDKRQVIARTYEASLKGVIKPQTAKYCLYNTFHVYPIRLNNRDKMKISLNTLGIETSIHYPATLEQIKILGFKEKSSRANQYSGELLSLPMHPFMTTEDVQYVCDMVNKYANH